MAALLGRVRKATQARGKKSELAKYLGKTPQHVNDWLAGKYSPGGDVTLQLLEWVRAEEANQQKTLGSVTSTAKGSARKDRRTRSTNPKHEKVKRVHKRT
jgi:transcriptional regulator with XRE-family HTH domain